MSFGLSMRDPATGEIAIVADGHDLRGSTYVVGGNDRAELSVTYNYWEHLRRALGDERGIRLLYGMTGRDSLPVLRAAIAQLGDDVTEDYWQPTEGNTKAALKNLLLLAQACPAAIWEGD